jgi:hypothetical protein
MLLLDCLQMTKALQKMSDCMQLVADLHEDSVSEGYVLNHAELNFLLTGKKVYVERA